MEIGASVLIVEVGIVPVVFNLPERERERDS